MLQGLVEMTFSEKLSELVDSSGLSKPKVAEMAGIKFPTFQDYLYKGKIPSATNLFKISKALGVSCEVFRDCEEEEPQKPKKKRK
jgi:transcriptional regulator with XRE-family HTH domain